MDSLCCKKAVYMNHSKARNQSKIYRHKLNYKVIAIVFVWPSCAVHHRVDVDDAYFFYVCRRKSIREIERT